MQIVNSMKGMENAKIIRPGYAIEYDFFDPVILNKHSKVSLSTDYSLLAKLMALPVMKKQQRKV